MSSAYAEPIAPKTCVCKYGQSYGLSQRAELASLLALARILVHPPLEGNCPLVGGCCVVATIWPIAGGNAEVWHVPSKAVDWPKVGMNRHKLAIICGEPQRP